MTEAERKCRQHEYYKKHKATTIAAGWEKQIRKCGWTPEEYHTAAIEQNGVCFICHSLDKRKLSADHCHKTGKRRHLLCGRCNRVLGLVEENLEIIHQMEVYCAKFSSNVKMEDRKSAQWQ
jgi:hypothetical protein